MVIVIWLPLNCATYTKQTSAYWFSHELNATKAYFKIDDEELHIVTERYTFILKEPKG